MSSQESSKRPQLLPHLSLDVGESFADESESVHLLQTPSTNIPSSFLDWVDTIRETLVCLAFFFLAWFGPKVLLPSEKDLESRPIPYQETAAGNVILDFNLNQPYVDPPTIPSITLVRTCVILPLLILLAFYIIIQKNMHDFRASICAFLVAIGCSEGSTQLLKLFVARKRPNFYNLCDFDKVSKHCMAPLSRLREAHLSFPSGHTSLSFCAMTFLVWFFLGKVGLARPTKRERTRRVLALASCILPWSFSAFVSVTRLVDHWHHPSDVLAGCLLGSTCGTVVYHLWYPHVFSPLAGTPYAALNHNNNGGNTNNGKGLKENSLHAY